MAMKEAGMLRKAMGFMVSNPLSGVVSVLAIIVVAASLL